MKLAIIFNTLFIIICSALSIFAQRTPFNDSIMQQQLIRDNELYERAVKNHDTELLISSLRQKEKYRNFAPMDWFEQLGKIEKYAKREKNIPVRNKLNDHISRIYTDLYIKYPQQALVEAEKIYRKAIKEHNTSLLIKSLIIKTTANLNINKATWPDMLKELEIYANNEKDIAAKSILNSYIAQLYDESYKFNQSTINERTPVSGIIPADMKTWSSNIFRDKFYNYLQNSISDAEQLKTIDITNYSPILIQGEDSRKLRPTLYDFLAHRAIDLLVKSGFPPNRNQPSITLSPLNVFLTQETSPVPLNHTSHIIKIYRELLSFLKYVNNQDALIITDLERLQYIWETTPYPEKNDSLYMSILKDMQKQYAGNPLVVEIIHSEAELILKKSSGEKKNKREILKQSARNLCEEGIRLYPNYPRIGILYNLLKEIFQPGISLNFPQTTYPHQDIRLAVSTQNITDLNIQLIRIESDTPTNSPYSDQYITSPKSKVYEKNYKLKSTLAWYDTTLLIRVPEPGLYAFIIKDKNGKEHIFNHFICTQLSSISRSSEDGAIFRVCDWISGEPIENAKISIYGENLNSYTAIETLHTDRQGMAKSSTQGHFYQVTDHTNPNGYIETFPRYWQRDASPYKTEIITDRKIYRPGQTVYFKGYTWISSPDTLYIKLGQTINVIFRDANYKEIANQTLPTNEFGSFTGSFVIPSHTMNGNFSITAQNYHANITVAEYKRPKFEITLSSDKPTYYRSGETIHLKGKANTFSGVPLQNDTVHYEISRYSFFRYYDNDNIKRGKILTNAEGEFELAIETEGTQTNPRFSDNYFYKIQARITDTKGETQETTITIPVFSGKYTITAQLPLQIDKNKKTPVILSLDDNVTGEVKNIEYSIYKLVPPDSIVQYLEIKDTVIDKMIQKGTAHLVQKDTIFPDLKKQASGVYLFSAKCDGLETKQIFYLYAVNDPKPPIRTYDWLVKEKTQCIPGESAKILFGTSVKDAYVMYEIYNGNKLIKREFPVLSDEILHIDIPYLAEYGNNIELAIQYIKNEKIIQHSVGISKVQENRELTLKTKVFRDKLVPGQKEQWELSIRNAKDKIVSTEILAMMYDASLDKIQDYSPVFIPGPEYNSQSLYWNLRSNRSEKISENIYPDHSSFYGTPPFKFDNLNLFGFYEIFGFRSIQYFRGASVTMHEAEVMGNFKAVSNSSDKISNDVQPVKFRENFAETAFFYPQLTSAPNGEVSIKFTVPEATTKWKFIAIANTKRLDYGNLTKYVTTSKEFMVTPNLPRFFRSGDQAEIKVTVNNLSDSRQSGECVFELFNPSSDEILFRESKPFTINSRESQTQSFSFTVPGNSDIIGCRVSASNMNFSDGEQQLVAVLPDKIMVTETLPFFSSEKGSHTFTMQQLPATRQDFRLTLEVTANPIWYVVGALPALTEPKFNNVMEISASWYINTIAANIARINPEVIKAIRNWSTGDDATLLSKLEQNNELKAVLLNTTPWVLEAQSKTERIQALAQLFDENRLAYLQEKASENLAKMQTPEGGWAWFEGMSPSRFMTANVLNIMAHMNVTGEKEFSEKEKDMQIKALRYLDNSIQKDSIQIHCISYDQIIYLYTRSMYRDIPLGDALDMHKHLISLAEKQWGRFSLYEKAITATLLHRYGFVNSAKTILESLRQYAVISPELGMYWPRNHNEFYTNDAVMTHVAIMEAFQTIEGNTSNTDKMKQWLLRQKQTQSWASVPSTVDAIYALLFTGTNQLVQSEKLTVDLGNKNINTENNNLFGYIKKSFTPSEITPEMTQVTISKVADTPTWGGLYLQYFANLDQIKKSSGYLNVDKKLFVEKISPAGRELLPVENTILHEGDKVIARLVLSIDRDMQFLYLHDLRASCFEPVNQLSGNHWKFGTVYYEEVKDASTTMFFNALSRGTYVIEYPMWVNQAGTYQDGIVTFQSFYAPEFSAHSDAVKITVK